MFEFVGEARQFEGGATHAVGDDSKGVASKIAREYAPPRCRVLVFGVEPSKIVRTAAGLSRMSRIEPSITTAGTLTAARFALATEEFDFVVLCAEAGESLSLALEYITGQPALVIADGADRTVALGCAMKGIPCVMSKAATPRMLQEIIFMAHPELRAPE